MKITYLHYLYGQDTALHHVRQFAEGARQLGHEVNVHAMNLAPPPAAGGNGGGPQGIKQKLRGALKRRFGRWLHDPKELWWNFEYIRRESAILRAERPDVLLVRSQGLGISCVRVAQKLGLPLVLEVNAPADETATYLSHQYRHFSRLRQWAGRYKLRRADALFVVSGALKQYYVDRHRLPPDKIFVVPNGADTGAFRPDTPPDPEFPRDERRPLIGYVGSFQPWHDLGRLGRIIEEVGRARPAARFLMVGAGEGVGQLQAETSLGPERLAFTGRVEHGRVPGLTASLDIGMLAEAAYYQCPLKVVEWMAAGKAIVAPGYPPLHELIEDGREGLLFPPGDFAAMREALLRLVDDAELRRRLGAAAAARAHSSLSWRDNAQRVAEACYWAIDRKRGAG
jgi:glycosyltransferase involved in cell wall biosynthesis